MSTSKNNPEPRPETFPARAEQRAPILSRSHAGSGPLEVGRVPASRESVYIAQRIADLAVSEFGTVEDALRWCGLDLSWTHIQHSPGRTMLIGTDARGSAQATVTGPLLAILPECCKVEVIR